MKYLFKSLTIHTFNVKKRYSLIKILQPQMFKAQITIAILFLIFHKTSFAQPINAEVLNYSTICEAQSDKLINTTSISIQINNRLGDKYSDISIPFSKAIKLSDLKAWITDTNGAVIRELKKSEIVEKSAISNISLYEDNYIKTFQLKHNIYPYRVNYSYKHTTNQFIEIVDWTPILDDEIPTREAKLKVVTPLTYQLKQHTSNISDPTIVKDLETICYEWNSSYTKVGKPEIFSNPELLMPRVILMPLNFKYGVEGSANSWESFGNWQFELNKGLDVLPESEIFKVNALIAGITDKREIVRTLYHYLQDHTRYINVSIGIGGMQTHPASYVVSNKYGDCKALTNYMKTLLHYAKIESFYALINAGDQPQITLNNFPSQQFNHVILAVPIDKDTIWLENTSSINPFGYMGTFTQNREALLISSNSSKLVKVPALKPEQTRTIKKIEFDLTVTGDAKTTISNCYKGASYDWHNSINSEFNDDEKNQIIRKYMPFSNYEVLSWDIKKPNRDSALIQLNATLTLYKILKPVGDEYYINIYPAHLPPFELPTNRTLPLLIPYPTSSVDTLLYNLPMGYEIKNAITPISIDSEFGNYNLKSTIKDGKLCMIRTLLIKSNNYSTEQYNNFYTFIQAIKESDKKSPIIIKPISQN